jgi:nicotinate dehydrogenase subunit B
VSTLPADIEHNPLLCRWVRVAADGMVEVDAGKVELGQGLATTQRQIAADELDLAPEQIRLRLGDTAHGPDQGLTAGSQSTETGAMALRRVCAEVRALFVQAAARRLDADVAAIQVERGRFSAAGRSLSYAELAADVDLNRRARGDVAPKPAAARRLSGTSLPRPDLRQKLFGAGFIHDLVWPDMLHGRVVRPPACVTQRPQLDAASLQALRCLPGVHTLHVDGAWIGVAAAREEQAIAAAEAVRRAARWSAPAARPEGDAEQRWLRALPGETSVVEAHEVETEMAVQHFEADYSRPFLAHASIGPSCALARWDAGQLTVCSHSQGVFALRRELAAYFNIALEQVTVSHADGAGCYGHNGADDVAVDAAILARVASRPVRLQWSREEELAWSPVGSAMSVRIQAALDAQGRIVDWQHDGWSFSHVQRPGLSPGLSCLASALCDPPAPPRPLRDFPLPAGGGQRNAVPLYTLPKRRIGYRLLAAPPLRTSALRALGAYANVFAIESAMDELAAIAGQDPLAFRLTHLDDPRATAVLQAAADAAGWSSPLPPARIEGALRGRGLGFARYKNSSAYCAVVVEAEIAERIVLERVWVAVDAGEVVHPDGLINQIEGGVLQAASWTLKEAVSWGGAGSAVREWADYPILGFDELPRTLAVQILGDPGHPPLGVGECAAGPTAAAIANALANALGLRARHLPLTSDRLITLMNLDHAAVGVNSSTLHG